MKKISIKTLLMVFKGMVGIKKCMTFLLLLFRRPVVWLWRAVLCPVLTFGYSSYRRMRRLFLAVYIPTRAIVLGTITGKYVAHVAIVSLSLMIAAGNIYASEAVPPSDYAGVTSILGSTTPHYEDEELVVEEALDPDIPDVKEISYLSSQAVSASEYAPLEEEFSVEEGEEIVIEGGDDADDETQKTLIVNALRAMPTEEDAENAAPVIARREVVDYEVEGGDSIGAIAQRFGLKATTVLWANDLSGRSVIRPGQTLRIPPEDGVLHKVKSGDTVAALARKYESDVDDILDANGLIDGSQIRIGEELMLPGGEPPPAPRPAPVATSYGINTDLAAATDDGSTQMLWPTSVRRVTQYFTWRHRGVDIAGPVGTPIYAADDGVVTYSGWNSHGYGNLIIIDHQNGYFTRYAHGSRNLIDVGDHVERGDVVQLMGSTGWSTGPHIHFEVLKGNLSNRLNPFNFIK